MYVYYKKYNFRIHQPCAVFHFHKINAGQRRSSTHLCLVQKVQAAPRDIILSDPKKKIKIPNNKFFWLRIIHKAQYNFLEFFNTPLLKFFYEEYSK